MKKFYKLFILLILLGIMVGSGINVYNNYQKQKKQKQEETHFDSKDNYTVKRKSNRYTIESTNPSFYDKEIKDFFYDDKNIYLYLTDEKEATILKYNIENNKVIVLYEDNSELLGGINKIGNKYIINNKIYNKNFKEIGDYVSPLENEKYFPDMNIKLIKNDDEIISKNIETGEEVRLLENTNGMYDLFSISDSGKTIILKKKDDGKESLAYLDGKDVKDININYNSSNDYTLLNDQYLLEKNSESDSTYKVFEIATGNNVFKSDKSDYIFSDNHLMSSKKNNDIYIMNYETQEERVVINSKKSIFKFICSSDSYSLVMSFVGDKSSFYIIYL